MTEHVLYHCGPYCEGCFYCEGGLSSCTVCGGAEASLPTDCPGIKMTDTQQDAVQAGDLDYRDCIGWMDLYDPATSKRENYE